MDDATTRALSDRLSGVASVAVGEERLGADPSIGDPARYAISSRPGLGLDPRLLGSRLKSTTTDRSEVIIVAEKQSGPREGLEGLAEGVKGKAKEIGGVVSGNDDLRDEGIAQQDKGEAQREVAQKEAEAEKARAEADVDEARQRSHQGRDQ